jgi:hypothetical protein
MPFETQGKPALPRLVSSESVSAEFCSGSAGADSQNGTGCANLIPFLQAIVPPPVSSQKLLSHLNLIPKMVSACLVLFV